MTVPSEETLHRQILQLTRGCEGLYTQQELQQRLITAADSGRPLRIKLGLDPTAPDIHLGHTVVLRKVRQFQDLGHKAVIIIGDYTARIGDPSGVNRTRPVLVREQIDAHAATYIEQAGKVLDVSPGKLEIRKNSEWLAGLNLADILRLTSQMTVARMMERDTFERRYSRGVPIGIHELLYPLMQGYDSVCIRADVELGGTDQTFNNLVGRQLQANAGQPPQIVMIMPILAGLDGVEKMSKSLGNYIGVTDEPNDMFGKVMSIPDKLMDNYFTLLTELPREEIGALLDPDQTHPRDAKVRLARLIVGEYHGPGAAEAAAAEFDRVFSQRHLPSDVPEFRFPEGPIAVSDMIVQMGFAASRSEARRLIRQNAVTVGEERVTDIHCDITISDATDGWVVKVGKRRFGRLRKDG